ncbi:hypothetical protein Tco_1480161, partial [Tanacetum coccineum]
GGSGFVAATEIPAPTERGQESVAKENAYLELADPGEGMAMVRQSDEEVVTEQPKKIKKKRLIKQSDVLPAKRLRTDHPSFASGTGGKTLAGLEQIMPAGSHLLVRKQFATPSVAPPQESKSFVDLSAQASLQIRTTVGSSSTLSAPVDTSAVITTSSKAKLAADVNPDLAGPSQLEELEGSDDSFYELATLDPSEAKRCCAELELELKEKLNTKYAARGKFLEKKDLEILRLKSQLAEKEAETAEHEVAGRSLSIVDAYNPEVASADYVNSVKALKDAHFPLVDLLKSKKDVGMDELSIPIHHAGDKMVVGETSLSFALMNVHARAEGAKKHVAALRQLMMETVSSPLSSQSWVGKASISVTPLSVEDYAEEDTDEALGSVVSVPNLERCCF